MQILSYILASFASLLLVYTCMPNLWLALMTPEEYSAYQARSAAVAARNPFRETGQPANMAKLILLRQKIQSSNRKRRVASQHSRSSRSSYPAIALTRQKPGSRASWIRFGRAFGAKQYH